MIFSVQVELIFAKLVILWCLHYFFLLFSFYIYSRLTNNVVIISSKQQTQPYMYIYPFFPKCPSLPGCHITMSRVSVLYSRSLLVIYSLYMRAKSLQSYPTLCDLLDPPGSSVYMSISIFPLKSFLFF